MNSLDELKHTVQLAESEVQQALERLEEAQRAYCMHRHYLGHGAMVTPLCILPTDMEHWEREIYRRYSLPRFSVEQQDEWLLMARRFKALSQPSGETAE